MISEDIGTGRRWDLALAVRGAAPHEEQRRPPVYAVSWRPSQLGDSAVQTCGRLLAPLGYVQVRQRSLECFR